MKHDYLADQMLFMAIKSISTNTGSISERLAAGVMSSLYNIRWEEVEWKIPQDCKNEFLELKKIIVDDIHEKLDRKRAEYVNSYKQEGIILREDQLEKIVNFQLLIKKMHWRKAKRAIECILHIYFVLNLD